jgi:hypothetical protein
MIYKLQLKRQFTRMAEEINREFQSVASDIPVSGPEPGPDMTWVRQAHFSLPQWQRRNREFLRISDTLIGVYNALFPNPVKANRRGFV